MFKGGTIRVVSPVREGGNRVRVDAETGIPMYKEEFFPLSSKREFDRLNRSLPNHLKKKIEVVNDGDVAGEKPKGRGKPGPKPKTNA